jgi:hypothetical protein
VPPDLRWTCTTCGEEHEGVPLNWASDEPDYWDGGRSEDDRLSADLCTWTDDDQELTYFIRGVLEIPIIGTGDVFGYGVWSSLSKKSFDRVLELWDDPRRTEEPAYFGWLSNSLPGYPDTRNLKLDVFTRDLDGRPVFELQDDDHPLVAEQRIGITMDRVRAIAELNMHTP